MEHRKVHLADAAHVADQSVGDAADAAALLGGGGEQLAPGRDALGGAAAAEHGHVARLEVVDQLDLDLVGILAVGHGIAVHVEPGAGAAEQVLRIVERAHERTQRLIAIAEAVEHVAQHGGVELVLVAGEIHCAHRTRVDVKKR